MGEHVAMLAASRRTCFLVLLASATGCGTQLAATRPADFVIERSTGGGMTPEGSGFRCDSSACLQTTFVSGARGEVRYEASARDLDEVYAMLRAHAFDRIDVRTEGEVHDRGGTTIRVDAGGAHYEVADSGSTFVVDVDDFRAVVDALTAFERRLSNASAVPCTIVLAEALREPSVRVAVDGHGDLSRSAEPVAGAPGTFAVRLAPGTHVVIVQTDTRRLVGDVTVHAGATFHLDADGESLTIRTGAAEQP